MLDELNEMALSGAVAQTNPSPFSPWPQPQIPSLSCLSQGPETVSGGEGTH